MDKSRAMSKIEHIKFSHTELPVIESNFKNTKWVKYGEKNNFPKKMIEYLSYSAVHKGVINLKKSLIAGNGFINENGDYLEFELNPDYSNDELLKRIANDYAIFNGFALEILWNEQGDAVAEVRHIDFTRIRAEWDDYDQPDCYYYSRDWEYYHLTRNKPKVIPVFNPDKVVMDGAIVQPRQIYYHYEPEPSIPYYPLPSYSPAFKDIEFDYQYGMFKANMMKNGMFPSLHMQVAGDPDDKKKKEFKKFINDKWAGAENAGGIVITYGASGDGEIKLTPIQLDAGADKFTAWKEDSNQNIISAHGLTSRTLAGLQGGAGLSGQGNEMNVALEQFQNSYVSEKQDYICGVFQRILEVNGYNQEIIIASKRPFTFIPDILWDIMTSEDIVKISKDVLGVELNGTNLPNNGEI